jgi:bacterial/archaeal transporter family protein
MGTGSLTSERVCRGTASETAQSSEAREVVVSEPPATPANNPGVDAPLNHASPSVGVGQIPVCEPSPLPEKQPDVVTALNRAPQSLVQPQAGGLIVAVRQSLKTKWFWSAMASSLCWTGWAFTAKIGSKEIPPATMEFISAFGFGLVSACVLGRKAAATDKSQTGKLCAIISGVLLALGGISLYGAYRTGYNASMVTAVTSLYPVVTVLCAVGFLRERLNKMQVVGLLFAIAAMSILSL